MRVVHLMASPFYGGPERQMLGLAQHLPSEVENVFVSFAEHGLAEPFLAEVRRLGFMGKALTYNTPRFFACVHEIAAGLKQLGADLLTCSGYKPDIIGWRAARRAGIPVVSISHGWTSATWRVRCYEMLDRWVLKWMDAVVCVSKAQADKVRRTRVAEEKIAVIYNAIGEDAFLPARPELREEMMKWFAHPPRWIIGAAGRLSPEKGYAVFIEAAALVVRKRPTAGFVLFGDGPLRGELEALIAKHGLQRRFVLAGFRSDLRQWLPSLDVGVMSSFTEGLPVVLLETAAAGVPTVATAVGGIPEVIDDGESGYLAASGDAAALAQRIMTLLDDDAHRMAMGRAAQSRIRRDFSLTATGQQYYQLFQTVLARTRYPQKVASYPP
jgi:glycosyltransferase involved in cell wall biosynthesis